MKNDQVLKNFMKEFFPYSVFKKMGFFTKEMKGDYLAQAKRVCHYFGFETVYEYRKDEIKAHITYAEGKRPLYVNEEGKLKVEPFVSVFPSIYD